MRIVVGSQCKQNYKKNIQVIETGESLEFLLGVIRRSNNKGLRYLILIKG
jgi:hypothetical protein